MPSESLALCVTSGRSYTIAVAAMRASGHGRGMDFNTTTLT